MKNTSQIICLAIMPLALSGCSSLGKNIDSIGKWDSGPLISSDTDKSLLLSLLNKGDVASIPKDQAWEVSLEQSISKIDQSSYANIRGNILYEFRAKSINLCQDYKLNLLRREARSNFGLGTAALLLGSAGAITTSIDAARVLAGGAAMSTGIRSEISQDFFYNQSVQVLTKAIDKRQDIQWGVINSKRDLPAEKYTIKEALVDLYLYHNTCSLPGALVSMEKAIETINVNQAVEAEIITATNLELFRSKLPKE